jgi:hypothetical protein
MAYCFGILAYRNAGRYFPGSRLLHRIVSLLPQSGGELEEIDLFDPTTKEYIRTGKLKKLEYDVFGTRIDSQFTYVRCMNILNRNCWFTDQQIAGALVRIKSSLVEGGLLQLGRTNDAGVNAATFYRKVGKSFHPVDEMGGGTELSDLVVTIDG